MTGTEENVALAYYRSGLDLHRQDRIDEAARLYHIALVCDPAVWGAWQLLGTADFQRDWHEDAVRRIMRAVRGNPSVAENHVNLAAPLMELERAAEAALASRRGLVLAPGLSEALANLGGASIALGDTGMALRHGWRAAWAFPGNANALDRLGLSLRQCGRHAEALPHLRAALSLEPANGRVLQNLALVEMDLGRAEAHLHFTRSMALKPDNFLFLRNLSDLHRFTPDDPWLAQLRRWQPQAGSMPETSRIAFHFTFAKALSDVGEKQASFEQLLIGNRLKRARIDYDEATALGVIEAVMQVFDRDFPRDAARGASSDLPVFILGLPRSGTTLIEQILASHPAVHAAGELPLFAVSMNDWLARRNLLFPTMLKGVAAEDLAALGQAYLSRLPAVAPGVRRITDKMPANLLFAGLIATVLPGARIIQLRRDLVDVCLSCFSKQFAGELPFTYDLAELGRYARASDRLMDHWEAVLPPDRLLSMRYEDVVEDLPAQAARLLDFCGLPWTDRVLSFHKTERAVRTASVNQVRKPIYKSSVGKWRPDEQTIAPLLAGLRGEG